MKFGPCLRTHQECYLLSVGDWAQFLHCSARASRRDLIFSFAGSIPYTRKSDSISLKHFSWNQGAQLLRYEWEEDGGRGAEMSCLFADPVDSQRTVIQQEYLWHNLIGLEGGHLCLVEVQFACMMYDVTHFMGNWVTVFVREKLPSLITHPPPALLALYTFGERQTTPLAWRDARDGITNGWVLASQSLWCCAVTTLEADRKKSWVSGVAYRILLSTEMLSNSCSLLKNSEKRHPHTTQADRLFHYFHSLWKRFVP